MSVRIRKLTLWRAEVAHRPGALAELLEPLAEAGADLQVVMGYRITAQRVVRAARSQALSPAGAPTLLVHGNNQPGLANRIARALAASRVNIGFLVAQVVGQRYSAVFGFENEADLDKAADRIRAAVTARVPRRGARP
jgi:hypothetical protein